MAYFWGKGSEGLTRTDVPTSTQPQQIAQQPAISPDEICKQKALAQGLAPGTPEYTNAINQCMGVQAQAPAIAQPVAQPSVAPTPGLFGELSHFIRDQIDRDLPGFTKVPPDDVITPPIEPPVTPLIEPLIEPPVEARLTCSGGTCIEMPPDMVTIPENMAACVGKSVGEPCGDQPPVEPVCQSDEECPEGQRCIDGRCQEAPSVTIGCYQGRCIEAPADKQFTVDQIARCNGKAVGDECADVIITGCTKDEDCPTGQVCRNGECTSVIPERCTSDTDCPEGQVCRNGECITIVTGCTSDADCPEGHTCVEGTCQPEEEVPPPSPCESNADCPENQRCVDGRCEEMAGYFEWPEELRLLYEKLMGRGQEVLDMPYGYTEEMMANMFGRDFEKIRGREAANREMMTSLLSRGGMLGTGTELEQMGKLSWGTESQISNIMRDLFIKGEEKKKEDIIDFSKLAQDIMGGGMQYTSLQEAINAARRGEGQDAMSQLIAWFMANMQSWAQ